MIRKLNLASRRGPEEFSFNLDPSLFARYEGMRPAVAQYSSSLESNMAFRSLNCGQRI